MTWLLRLQRSLGLVAPEDGLCGWKHEYIETYSTARYVSTERVTFVCKKPWRHKDGHHAERVGEGA